MRIIRQLTFTLSLLLIISVPLIAQNNFFTDAGANRSLQSIGQRVIVPQQFRASQLDVQGIKSFLRSLPDERSVANRSEAPILTLPLPNGQAARFRVWESSIQAPALQAKFPGIRTYAGQGIDDPYATIRFDITERGFHAQVLTVNGTYYIDPYAIGNVEQYISYFRKDLRKASDFHCDVQNEAAREAQRVESDCRGTELKTFRLAVACTGEYAQAPGIAAGTNAALLHSAIVTSVNRVVGVYETEIAVRLQLVASNSSIEFLNPLTDPFTGNNSASTLIGESQTVIDANIGAANYDIGHTFSTGGGGLATLRSVCTASKARGITGNSFPTGDSYDIDYVAHEMGHQFGGNHSMAGCGDGPNNAKYEVGSGTSIMAYAGICASQDIQPHSDPFFHAISFDEISTYLSSGDGATCGVITPTGNALPVINPLPFNNLSIPVSTPFTLTATASDINGDAITYCWEQFDFSGQAAWNAGANAAPNNTLPLFKSRVPKTTGSRTFPDMAVIRANYPANPPADMDGLKGETLSPVPRVMKFRLTVRDNRAGGGGVVSSGASGCQNSENFQVNVVGNTPFKVNVPNGGEAYEFGTTQVVTWDVAATNVAPVNVSNVRILLSTDGGVTFPTVLLASTLNDGSEPVVMPSVATTTARIKIEAIANIFFDISDANFSLTVPPFYFTTPAPVTSPCPAPATLQATLGTVSNGSFTNPITLTATGNPAGTTVTFTPNPVIPGNNVIVTLNNASTLSAGTYNIAVTGTATGASTQTNNLSFTITASAGPAIVTQPVSQNICTGTNTSFSISSPAATSIQWQVSIDGGVNYSNVVNNGVYSGATTSTLTITGFTALMNNYRYRAIASVQCGSTTSAFASISIKPPPAITTQPQNATICIGGNNTFSTVATGESLTYQWQLSSDGGNVWNDIPGALSSTYAVTNAAASMNNYRYRVIVNGACPPAATSSAAILTVITPVAIAAAGQPVNAQVCSGSNAIFNVTGISTEPISYRWQVNTGSGFQDITNGSLYSGANTSTLTINGATMAMNGYQYRVQVWNNTCTAPTISAAARLTVRQLPSVGLTAAATSLLPGQSTTLTATPSVSTGGVLSTTWLYNNNPVTNTGNVRVVTIETVGTYQVIIKEEFAPDANNPNTIVCTNQSQAVVITAEVSERLFIFPNPNSGQFTVSFYNSVSGTSQRTVTIYDSRGAKVYHSAFTVVGSYTLLPISLPTASRGVYHLVVGNSDGKKIAKGSFVIN